MSKIVQMYLESVQEMKKARSLAGISILLAINVALSFVGTVEVTPTLKIGTSFLAVALTGMLYGPAAGGAAAALGDIIGYLLRPTGPYFPGFTLSAFLGGAIYGLFLYRNRITILRAVCAKGLINLVVNIGFNTLWNSLLYGNGFWAILPARALKNVMMLPLEATILYLVLRVVLAALRRSKLVKEGAAR
ncbi:MAG: folate family ECF transporter S component [Oscillospiraceae bacterium]|nr:folate family ECF transporter S component [Oscillospiraceae bacterium]